MQFPELEYFVQYDTIKLKSNTSIAYTDMGQGSEVLLFIHGLASYLPSWHKLIPLLKDRYRCIAIDLPGYGKSQEGINPSTPGYFSDIIMEFIQALNLKNINLAGHSMGGQISITFAVEHPDIINKLILLAPAGLEKFTEWEKNFIIITYDDELVCSGSDELITKNLQYNFYNMPADAQFLIEDSIKMKSYKNFNSYREVIKRCVRGMLEEPVSEKLNQIECPAMIIYGQNDYLIPNRYVHKDQTVETLISFADIEIPRLEPFVIAECGHYVQLEKPEAVKDYIIRFLDSSK